MLRELEPMATKGALDDASKSCLEERYGTATVQTVKDKICLLYTSDAADERSSVDLGGRRIIKKKKHDTHTESGVISTQTNQFTCH